MDQVYNLFIDAVARNRGVSSKQVLENMADGRVFIGQQAVDSGLADAVGTFQDAFMAASAMIPDRTAIRPAGSIQRSVSPCMPEREIAMLSASWTSCRFVLARRQQHSFKSLSIPASRLNSTARSERLQPS